MLCKSEEMKILRNVFNYLDHLRGALRRTGPERLGTSYKCLKTCHYLRALARLFRQPMSDKCAMVQPDGKISWIGAVKECFESSTA